MVRWTIVFSAIGWLGIAGCQQAPPPQFLASDAAQELSPELRHAVQSELEAHTGSFLKPKLLLAEGEGHHDLARGQQVYQERCVQCHGVSGDGNGPSGRFMYPRPRDYRKGIFKFTSTPYGFRPLRTDLVRTVRQGVRGTSMPAFHLLPDNDIECVVDYVLALTRRGELEQQLIGLAESEEAVDGELVRDDLIPTIVGRWTEAESAEVLPATPKPRFTREHAERGKQAFLSKGCSKCHGEDGRGQTADNRGADAWGFQTRAADLTSGMLHGGNQPVDIYRRIYNGINGTPMPSFANALKEEPDTIWDLVAYVLLVSNERRSGNVPLPGLLRPYVVAAEE